MGKIELNFKGMPCPMPIIKTSMAVKRAASGDVLELTSDDPAFEPDITAWSRETGNTLTGVTKSGKDVIATITKK